MKRSGLLFFLLLVSLGSGKALAQTNIMAMVEAEEVKKSLQTIGHLNNQQKKSPNNCQAPENAWHWTRMGALPVGPPIKTYEDVRNFLAPAASGFFEKPWQRLFKQSWGFLESDLQATYAAAMQGEGSNFVKIQVKPCELILEDMMFATRSERGEYIPHTVGRKTIPDWEDKTPKNAWVWRLDQTRVLYFFEDCSNPTFSLSFKASVAEEKSQETIPKVEIRANRARGSAFIPYNSPAIISWDSENCSECVVEPGSWAGLKNGGVQTSPLKLSQVFTVTCESKDGKKVEDSVAVYVEKPPPEPAPPPQPVIVPPAEVKVEGPQIKVETPPTQISIPLTVNVMPPGQAPASLISAAALACPDINVKFESSLRSRSPLGVFENGNWVELALSVATGAAASYIWSDNAERVHAAWQAAGFSAGANGIANAIDAEVNLAVILIAGKEVTRLSKGKQVSFPGGIASWEQELVQVFVSGDGGFKLCAIAHPNKKFHYTPVVLLHKVSTQRLCTIVYSDGSTRTVDCSKVYIVGVDPEDDADKKKPPPRP